MRPRIIGLFPFPRRQVINFGGPWDLSVSSLINLGVFILHLSLGNILTAISTLQ